MVVLGVLLPPLCDAAVGHTRFYRNEKLVFLSRQRAVTADGVRPAATKSATYVALRDLHTTYDLTLTTQASMIHTP